MEFFAEKVNKISEIDKDEKSNNKEVVGLMMFLGSPPKLKEHLMMPSNEDCLIKKEIAEMTSSALSMPQAPPTSPRQRTIPARQPQLSFGRTNSKVRWRILATRRQHSSGCWNS